MPSDPTGWPDEACAKEPTPGDDRYAIRFTLADVEAREQAAAVAMRKDCIMARDRAVVPSDYLMQHVGADAVAQAIEALPLPTDALAVALAQARRDALEEAAVIAFDEINACREDADTDLRSVRERAAAAIRAKAQEAAP